MNAYRIKLAAILPLFRLALVLALATSGAPSFAQSPPAAVPLVESVDLTRFMGNWYVIAQIAPDSDQDAHNAVEGYELVDGKIETTYRRRRGSFEGPEEIDTPTGIVEPDSGNALWGMRFWWWLPIKLEYRISYLEPDYSVTIIARSKRDYVWLMSRRPNMNEVAFQRYRNIIAEWGYDVARLKRIPQRWPPSG